MPANELIPYKSPGQSFSFKATAAVIGKRLVVPTGNRTGGPGLSTDLANAYQCANVATRGGAAVGVAKYDVANGAMGGAETGGIVPITAGAAITAGQRVMATADGRVEPVNFEATGGVPNAFVIGVAMNGAAAGADAEILLTL